MRMRQLIMCMSLLVSSFVYGQSEEALIRQSLNNYIEGTSYSYPERIKAAFYDEASLYLSRKDQEMWFVGVGEYASLFEKREKGKFTGRIGNIISIDHEGGIATAKAEILMPQRGLRYVDMFLLKKLSGEWKIISKTATGNESNKHGDKVLFVVSNASFYGNSDLKTGNSFSEIVRAHEPFAKSGYTVDFVSPEGGAVPLAYINTSVDQHKQYLYDADFMGGLANTLSPEQVAPSEYQALYFVGGGSAMYGVPENKAIQRIAIEVYEKHGGIISSVCHGTAGIVNLKTSDGQYLVRNKRVSGYPEAYEAKEKAYFKQFPFLIQKTIEERGGTFENSPKGSPHLEVDGRLVTGQNHLSSGLVANKIIEMLQLQQ